MAVAKASLHPPAPDDSPRNPPRSGDRDDPPPALRIGSGVAPESLGQLPRTNSSPVRTSSSRMAGVVASV